MSVSRRRFLTGAGLAAGSVAGVGAVLAGCGESAAPRQPPLPHVALPAPVAGLPDRQHAWTAFLGRDVHDNPVAPRYDRLVFFDVLGTPTPAHARILEAALRGLERRYPWRHDGLLFTAAWGPSYFRDLLHVPAPIPAAKALSTFENPSIDSYHLCLHLAGDDADELAAVESGLRHGPGSIADALVWRETRTGFTGAGLPAAHQDVSGIPAGRPVPAGSPLYMGFASNLRGNQASEDAVSLPTGPFRDGTTMAVSYMTLSLDSWYGGLTREQRIARMYAPEMSAAQQAAITTDAESDPGQLPQAIQGGVIGHAQTCARARRRGQAILLRRDFNTDDGGQAGLHFVSLQRDIQDFITVRTQMNAAQAPLQNPAITNTDNNGINAFIFVLKRANYLMPPRALRSFPALPDVPAAVRQTA